MVIEHEFVTTLEGSSAMQLCRAFLTAHGFREGMDTPAIVADDHGMLTLSLRRGLENAAAAKSVSELPQRIIVQFDRGRITIAASISPNTVWGGAPSAFSLRGNSSLSSQTSKLRAELLPTLMTTISSGIERVIAGESIEDVAMDWTAVNSRIATQAELRRKEVTRMWIVFWGFAVFLLLLIVWGVAASSL